MSLDQKYLSVLQMGSLILFERGMLEYKACIKVSESGV